MHARQLRLLEDIPTQLKLTNRGGEQFSGFAGLLMDPLNQADRAVTRRRQQKRSRRSAGQASNEPIRFPKGAKRGL